MRSNIFFIVISCLLVISCEKNQEGNDILITKSEITGTVQKGPFLNGTAIDIYELDKDLTPTGKSFSSQIMDNAGLFELERLTFISQFLQIKANGYYFNEISGENSNSPINLYALADITSKNSVNVNILTHIAKSRVEYLIQDEGKSFAEANIQTKQEILKIFSMQKSEMTDFDKLNISIDGDDHAILLAISLIAQGFRSESELSDLLAGIITDIRQDGELNSSSAGSLLINDARLFDFPDIRKNLEGRYQDLGITATIPDFEKYINMFVDNTLFEITNHIEYPETSNYQLTNVLFPRSSETITLTEYVNYSIAANLPKGTSLKVTVEPVNSASLPNPGYFAVQTLPNGPVNFQADINGTKEIKTLTSIASGYCDVIFSFLFTGDFLLKVYENGDQTPTITKTLKVKS